MKIQLRRFWGEEKKRIVKIATLMSAFAISMLMFLFISNATVDGHYTIHTGWEGPLEMLIVAVTGFHLIKMVVEEVIDMYEGK